MQGAPAESLRGEVWDPGILRQQCCCLASAWVSQEARAYKANIYSKLPFWVLGRAEGIVAPHRPGIGRWLCGVLQHLVLCVAGVLAPSWGTILLRPRLGGPSLCIKTYIMSQVREKCGTELISGLLQTEEESTILQMEKNLRTHVEVLQKQKRDRKQELKALQEQDRELCDILCTAPFSIDSGSVPSLEDLDRYRRHVASLNSLKVGMEGPGVAEGPARGPWLLTLPSPPGAKAGRICQQQASNHSAHGGAGPHPRHQL